MHCTISQETIDRVIAFHGHRCPGLAIGIRAAEFCLREFPDTASTSLVCVTETDMCGVDAIQFLTGCTFGKGNLIHRDYGKMAFSFFHRDAGHGIRLLLQNTQQDSEHEEMAGLLAKSLEKPLTEAQQQRLQELRKRRETAIMAAPLDELFASVPIEGPAPRPARILQSLNCASCGEKTMESRTRRLAGQTLCIPCFHQSEQKI